METAVLLGKVRVLLCWKVTVPPRLSEQCSALWVLPTRALRGNNLFRVYWVFQFSQDFSLDFWVVALAPCRATNILSVCLLNGPISNSGKGPTTLCSRHCGGHV